MHLWRILCDRWRNAWREVAAATVAAILAWMIAQKLFGHPHPIFAAVIAIVALGPGIANHRKQAWGSFSGWRQASWSAGSYGSFPISLRRWELVCSFL